MLQSAWNYIQDRLPCGQKIDIPAEVVDSLACACKTEPWHAYAIHNRHRRPHVYVATRWLAAKLPKNAVIFEPGCGSGVNLLWLAAQGFSRLQGSDLSPEAVALAHELAKVQGLSLDIWQDDSLKPQRMPQDLDGILSVNWLYHVPQATLSGFLNLYAPALKKGGIVVCDMVTHHYNSVENNKYHSKDWKLPAQEKRPSEYTIRHSAAEVAAIAEQCGFYMQRSTCLRLSRPQRAVYELTKV